MIYYITLETRIYLLMIFIKSLIGFTVAIIIDAMLQRQLQSS